MKVHISNSRLEATHTAIDLSGIEEFRMQDTIAKGGVYGLRVRGSQKLKSNLGIPTEISDKHFEDALHVLVQSYSLPLEAQNDKLKKTPLFRELLGIGADVSQIASTLLSFVSNPNVYTQLSRYFNI